MPRTLIREGQEQDISFISEGELNEFFGQVVITGTEDDTTVLVTFSGLHDNLDTLTHGLAENATTEIVRNIPGQVTDVNVRTVPVTGTLIRSTSVTRNPNNQVITIVERQHDASGTVVQTLTSTVNRTSGKVTSVTTVET